MRRSSFPRQILIMRDDWGRVSVRLLNKSRLLGLYWIRSTPCNTFVNNDYSRYNSVSSMLTDLNWPSLQSRRRICDMGFRASLWRWGWRRLFYSPLYENLNSKQEQTTDIVLTYKILKMQRRSKTICSDIFVMVVFPSLEGCHFWGFGPQFSISSPNYVQNIK